MLQLIIQGRGGQGSQLAGRILAEVFFRDGLHVLSFATYGGARRGAPVTSSLRVDDEPIRLRCEIDTPDVIACFDPSLLSENGLLLRAAPHTRVLINTPRDAADLGLTGNVEVITIDAAAVAMTHGLGRMVNTAMVGAVLGLLEHDDVELVQTVVEEICPERTSNNVAACLQGYRMVIEEGR